MSGSVRIARDLFDDTAFKQEPFSEREAFVWLIMEASYKPRSKRVGRAELSLDRGQLAASLRFMAGVWGWPEPRVRRYLERLKNRRMIDAVTDAGVTVITVCKYNDYQSKESTADAVDIALPTQQRRVGDANKNKDEIKDIKDSEANASAADAAPDYVELLWSEGRRSLVRQTGKTDKAARALIGQWRREAKEDCRIVYEKIVQAETDRVSDPVAWIAKAVQPRDDWEMFVAREQAKSF